MRSSLSRRKIIEYFDKYDRRLTVCAYDIETETRMFTYSNVNLFQALQEIQFQMEENIRDVRIYLDLPEEYSIHDNFYSVPEKYIWVPNYAEFR